MTKKSQKHVSRFTPNALRKNGGFTFVEIMLVLVIIGVMLAVIVPRAWRANVDAKYNLLRQSCTELASWANEWANRQLESQPGTSASNIEDYLNTLGRGTNPPNTVYWIGRNAASNWNTNVAGYLPVPDRGGTGIPANPASYTVQDIMPQEKVIKNPFNGLSVFSSGNDASGGSAISGAIACTWQIDTSVPTGTYRYYALIFLGTDSTSNSDFHAGQDNSSLGGLRNGVFLAGLEQ